MYNLIFYAFYESDAPYGVYSKLSRLFASWVVTMTVVLHLLLCLVIVAKISDSFRRSFVVYYLDHFRLPLRSAIFFIVLILVYFIYSPDRIMRLREKYWEREIIRYRWLKMLLPIGVPIICYEAYRRIFG